MKAISLWQPWASLIAIGAKRVETRSWAPPVSMIGSRIAIHAAKHRTDSETIASLLLPVAKATGACVGDTLIWLANLPRGEIVCTVRVVCAKQVSNLTPEWTRALSEQERAFGDYGTGRWGWVLDDVVKLPQPIPYRGAQGPFNVPDELLGRPVNQERLFREAAQ